ncbi:MAG: methylthioribulose 1-phosphate dehydratase [Myxococcales bacterium]|nr:methylthioribulose 1-phosphate dehydratase [Myxococcales bacterium]
MTTHPPIVPAIHDAHLLPALESMVRYAEQFHRRGWLLGTSGSLSVCHGRAPLKMTITVSGKDKGALTPWDFLTVTDQRKVFAALADPKASSEAYYKGDARPSGETLVHKAVYDAVPDAQAICHTHSVAGTLCSQLVAPGESLVMSGLEMLKGLGHWEETPLPIPVVYNDRDIPALAELVKQAALTSSAPGVLVAGHGIYVWGPDLERAKRHTEIFEFLFEYEVRRRAVGL